MLKISQEQLRKAHVGTDTAFAEWFVEDIMKTWLPQYYFSVSDTGKREMVKNGRRYAIGFGLDDPQAQAHFVSLMWEIGPNFYVFPGFSDVLQRADIKNMEKIDLLFDGTVTEAQAVKAIMNPDDRYWYRENLTVAQNV